MSDSYDLVVIGGGAAGLTAAGLGASAGARTLLIEKDRLGGDCTWTGCVPSKTLLRSARAAQVVRDGHRYGLHDRLPSADFGAVMRRVRDTCQAIYEEAEAPENLAAFGIEVRFGTARFLNPHLIQIEHEGEADMVEARYVVIATGGRASAPPIPGLGDVDYLTSNTLFELKKQPERLGIIGAGPIGTEMAQAFQRLGTQVTVLERADRMLLHDHPALTAMLQQQLESEGVRYLFEADIERVEKDGAETHIQIRNDGTMQSVRVDALLVATGRRPDVDLLGLEAAGVEYTNKGITVNDRCRTSRKHIYAAGDVTGRYPFTHMGEHMAKVAVSNALLKVPKKIDAGRVPWVTYTDPELAHIGATEAQLQEENARYETYRFPLDRLDRAICEGETQGEIRIYATKWTGKILGADVLSPRAGELIGTLAVAMKAGASLAKISDTLFPYPTFGLGVRRAADQWYAQKQRPWLVRGLQMIFGYKGPVFKPDPDRIV